MRGPEPEVESRMKRAEIEVGREHVIGVYGTGRHDVTIRALVLSTEAEWDYYGEPRTDGVLVEFGEDRKGYKAGTRKVIPARRVVRLWSDADDEQRENERTYEQRSSTIEAGLARFGIPTTIAQSHVRISFWSVELLLELAEKAAGTDEGRELIEKAMAS